MTQLHIHPHRTPADLLATHDQLREAVEGVRASQRRYRELVDAVEELRATQRAFERSPTRANRWARRDAESRVDELLALIGRHSCS